ncbi:hypothetical protein IWQ56_006632, partial [Coemansia nantahalensis]
IGLDELLGLAGIDAMRLDQFTKNFSCVFTAVALHCPAYAGKLETPTIDKSEVSDILGARKAAFERTYKRLINHQLKNSEVGEAGLVPYFLRLYGAFRVSRAIQSADDQLLWPSQDYVAAEHQTKPLLGGVHKIDGAIHFKNHDCVALKSVQIPIEAKTSSHTGELNNDVFGQLADYAHALWGCQPTRTFVPALLLHASHMTLVVFTRDKWYRCDLGDFCYSTKAPTVDEVERLCSSLTKLAFLLTLPPQEFGHFCDIGVGSPTQLRFTLLAAEPTGMTMRRQASVVRRAPAGEGVVRLDEGLRIKRKCYPRGRLVFLYRVKVAEKDAILKLMWTP